MTACVENALIFYHKNLWVRTFRLGIFIIKKEKRKTSQTSEKPAKGCRVWLKKRKQQQQQNEKVQS